MKIAIDAGHGKNTAGKRCLKSIDSKETREWTLNADIASRVVKLLAAYNCETMRTDDTTGKTDVELATRCSKANKWKADYFVSIHNDAGLGGKKGGGTTVFAYAEGGKGAKLRDAVYSAVIASANSKGNRADGTRTANYYVLKKTTMPAILIECEFMDSADRTPLLLTEAYRAKIAQGIVNGIVKHCGLTKKKTVATTPEETKMKYYEKIEEIPTYYRAAVQVLIDKRALKGTGTGLHLSEDMCRIITVMHQAGAF